MDKNDVINRIFVSRLTDTHCRFLATLRNDGDVRNYITFLDGDEFLSNYGFGEDICGNKTDLEPKEDIRRIGTTVTSADKDFLLDVVGRYTVTIGGNNYDTVCVMDVETYNCGVVSEQFWIKTEGQFFVADSTVMTGLSTVIRYRGVSNFPKTTDLL